MFRWGFTNHNRGCGVSCAWHRGDGHRVQRDARIGDRFAELVELAGHFHDGLVKPHDVPRGLKSLGAEAFFEQSQRVIKLAVGHGKQRHTVAHDRAVDIAPQAPFGRVDGEERVAALVGIERGEKRFSGFADRLRRNSGLLNRK